MVLVGLYVCAHCKVALHTGSSLEGILLPAGLRCAGADLLDAEGEALREIWDPRTATGHCCWEPGATRQSARRASCVALRS